MTEAPTPAYRYRAKLARVIDGDTYELDLDLGLRVHAIVLIRLLGLDCPEMSTSAGRLARSAALDLIADRSLVVETYRDHQTFQRWVAAVWIEGKGDLAELLRAAGHVK